MATLVQQLRSEQLTYWLQNGISGYDVFKLLKLEDDGYEALHRLKFQALEDYITKINSEKSAGETMLNVLTKAFGDESKLVPLIETAKSRRRSMMKGFELEAALLAKWRSDDLPLNEIWVRLKIGNNVYDALKSAELRLFSKYVSKYYPTNEKAVVEMLIATYGDVRVATALGIAKTKATTADIAAKLQVQQLEGWLSSQRSANDVFKLLKIEEDGLRFVNSPKWEILSDFIKVFNSNKNPEDMTDMFTVLRNVYHDDDKFFLMLTKEQTSGAPLIAKTAIQYRDVLLEEWIRSDIKPTDIYRKFFNGKEGIQEKKIVARYTEYYDEEMDIPVHVLSAPL
ncbi:hypothetical protein PInf_008549 [Phytophthora infestans]|nr:hypothetical protein PInf_008549 [Phytophthora infestans]